MDCKPASALAAARCCNVLIRLARHAKFLVNLPRLFTVLNRKRPLSLRMVKRLHDGLKIPYESLLTEGS